MQSERGQKNSFEQVDWMVQLPNKDNRSDAFSHGRP